MAISTCIITGNLKSLLNAAVQNCTVTASVVTPFIHLDGTIISGQIASTTTDSSGNFSMSVIETTSVGQKVTFTFTYYDGVAATRKKAWTVVVPNQTTARLADIIAAAVFPATVTTLPAGSVTVNPISGLISTDAQAALAEIETQVQGKQASGNYLTGLTGDVTATGPGAVTSSVNAVGGSTAANVHSAEQLANAATNLNTASAIVKRDASGNFAAGTITAALTGNASSATTATTATGPVTGSGHGAVTLDASAHFQTVAPGAAGHVLRSNGTDYVDSAIQAADIPTLNQNTTGTAANVTGTVAIGNGGTGQTSAAAAFGALSPLSTKGDILTYGTANTRLPIGSDGQVPVADSTQTNGLAWKTLQQGAKNYITYNSFENNSTTGWSLAHSALTSLTPTSAASAGTAFDSTHGGSAAAGTLALSTVSSGQLAGSYSASLASSAATTAGDLLISQAYTIDIEDQAKCLAFKFAYKASVNPGNGNWSGTSANTWQVWIYDVTNAAWIQPAGVYNLVQSSGVGIASGTFQTPSNMTQFQIALVNINASSGAMTMLLDDFSVGPQAFSMGPAMDDWVQYPAVFAGLGTVVSPSVFSRRVGDTLQVRGSVTAGTTTAVLGTMTLGYKGVSGNVSQDSTKVSNGTLIGTAVQSQSSATFFGMGILSNTASPTLVVFSAQYSTIAETDNGQNASSIIGTGKTLEFFFQVPILGWSSNTAMSADTDTRVAAARFYLGTNQTGVGTSADTLINFDTVAYDTHGAFLTSGHQYFVPQSGIWELQVQAYQSLTATTVLGYRINNGTTVYIGGQSGGGRYGATAQEKLNAGDAITFIVNQSATSPTLNAGNSNTFASVKRLSGPAVVQATESVKARGVLAASSISTAYSTLDITSVTHDSHGQMSVSGDTYTAPVSGEYEIGGLITFSAATYAVNDGYKLAYSINGGTEVVLGQNFVEAAQSVNKSIAGKDRRNLNAGDVIRWRAKNAKATALTATPEENYVYIGRVGN